MYLAMCFNLLSDALWKFEDDLLKVYKKVKWMNDKVIINPRGEGEGINKKMFISIC